MRPSRAGGKVPHGHNTNQSAPLDDTTVLTYNGGGSCSWVWNHVGDPFQWIVDVWDEGEEGFASYSIEEGSVRSFDFIAQNGRFQVWPADEPQNHLGPDSNEILVEDR